MIRILKHLIFIFIGALILSGCSPVYIPNAPFVFNNQQQGDYEVNYRQGAYSSNLQGGYAISDNLNLGLALSSLYSAESSVASTVYKATKAYDVNIVAGYYNKFTAKHVFEMNAGVGSVFMSEPQNIKDYYKFYVQPSITFAGTEGRTDTDFTMLTRLVGTSFRSIEGASDTSVFQGYIEPVLSFSVGNQFRFNTQLGVSLGLQENYFKHHSPFIFNIGIGYTLPRKREEAILP
ncbi:MAG: hypothetical protein COA58_06575 [Bacteroidetes bacterium]|nr:MAG: hypothetical protein COA58_06575 [Bacteroidota bacterium]